MTMLAMIATWQTDIIRDYVDGEEQLMASRAVSAADVEQCKQNILAFLRPPVNDKRRQAMETYHAGNVEDIEATLRLGSDYEACLCSLLKAGQDNGSAIDCSYEAADAALKFAGAADRTELYAKLAEILPEHFARQ